MTMNSWTTPCACCVNVRNTDSGCTWTLIRTWYVYMLSHTNKHNKFNNVLSGPALLVALARPSGRSQRVVSTIVILPLLRLLSSMPNILLPKIPIQPVFQP
jgi:hypothetical protein